METTINSDNGNDDNLLNNGSADKCSSSSSPAEGADNDVAEANGKEMSKETKRIGCAHYKRRAKFVVSFDSSLHCFY